MRIRKYLKDKIFTQDFYRKYFTNNPNNYIQHKDTYDNYNVYTSDITYKKYESTIKKHFELSDKIQVEYSIAINQENIFNDHTKKCEQLCLKDIELAPIYKEYLDSGTNNEITFYGMYTAFSTLAKIYEKKNDLSNAILVCIQAIKLGFVIDGTKGKMQGRIARLIKKHNQNCEIKLQFDYDNNILYDMETGETIIE